MTPQQRVLCVDDEEGMREVCHDAIARLPNVIVDTVADPAQAAQLTKEHDFDLVITDIQMQGMTGIELLEEIRKHDEHLPVVVITGFPSVETAVEAMRLGAVDYVTKPFHPDDLMNTVRRLLELQSLRRENELLRRQVEGRSYAGEMLGTSPQMVQVFETIEKVSDSGVDVLIQGETGTGKELVARAIHRHSNRMEKPFVPVNCGAIPEHLLEAEFFGYEKGAFTGADSRSIGLMEYANGGTLFLDEIVELPQHMQSKLLRVLQERKLRRVGANDEIEFDVRIISASARNLSQAVADGVFRRDLYYRLDVVTIHLPPLRERIADIGLLTEHFLERYAREIGKKVEGISAKALEAIEIYPWPGNIRELQNVTRRAIALTGNSLIELDDLPEYIAELQGGKAADDRSSNSYFRLRDAHLARFEKDYFSALLRKHAGNVPAATQEADLPRGSFYRYLKKHGINPKAFRNTTP